MNTLPGIFLGFFVTAIMALAGEPAEAHSRSQSFSHWTVADEQLEMRFTVKAREVTRLPPLEGELRTLEALLLAHLQRSISVRANGDVCPSVGLPSSLPAALGYLRVRWTFNCPIAATKAIHLGSFFALAPSHVHYARIDLGDDVPEEYLFTDDVRQHEVTRTNEGFDSLYYAFVQYTALGLEHIFGGIDHIAFLLALLLLFRRLREVIWMVSGFTVGHSITLSLAATGLVVPSVSVIEALIGFTIALVALENIGAVTMANRKIAYGVTAVLLATMAISIGWGRGLPLLTLCGLVLFTIAYLPLSDNRQSAVTMRPFLTLAFGLIHGFGFASVLTEVGLPEQRLIPALAGFNIGVELGQILIVVALWCAARWVTRSGLIHNNRAWLDAASAVLCALGTYWFVARSFAFA